MSKPRQIPMWYIGNFREPERVTVAEGAEWPAVDSAGNVIFSNPHHFENWADAKAAIVAEHNAGRKMATRFVIESERQLVRAREALAAQCKALLAAENLTAPEDI